MEWKRMRSQCLVAFLSLPWLNNESNGFDLDLFKDKSYKQCSANLISTATPSTTSSSIGTLKQIKLVCIQMLALIPSKAYVLSGELV